MPLHAAAAIGPGAHLTIEFADGRVGATADADRPRRRLPPRARRKPRRAKRSRRRRSASSKPVDQGSLF